VRAISCSFGGKFGITDFIISSLWLLKKMIGRLKLFAWIAALNAWTTRVRSLSKRYVLKDSSFMSNWVAATGSFLWR